MKKALIWLVLGGVAAILGLMVFSVGGEKTAIADNAAIVDSVKIKMEKMDGDTVQLHRKLARWYNLMVSEKTLTKEIEDAYWSILNLSDGIMGYLEIPSAKLMVPIYHGEEGASKGMGHVPESALPIGGLGNHCLLISDIACDNIREGDTIILYILDEMLIYKADGIPHGQQIDPVDERSASCTIIFRGNVTDTSVRASRTEK